MPGDISSPVSVARLKILASVARDGPGGTRWAADQGSL